MSWSFISLAAIAEIQAQAITTARTKATLTGPLDPEAIPKKAAKKIAPVIAE